MINDLIKKELKPFWDSLVKECPEVETKEEMTFDDFCDEVRLSIDLQLEESN